MEEKNLTAEVKEQPATQQQKMSYDQLSGIAHQLSQQVRKLQQQVAENNAQNIFARLSFLFKVVEMEDKFFTSFVDKCKQEIEELMSIPEEEVELEKPTE